MQFNELDIALMSATDLARVFCIGDIHSFGYKLLVKVLQRQDVRDAIVRDRGLVDDRERDLLVRAAKAAGVHCATEASVSQPRHTNHSQVQETEEETMKEVLISKGMNRKLKKGGIAVFNLPAGLTCGGPVCPGCYAMKAQRMYKSAREKRLWNFNHANMPDFVSRISTELASGHCKAIKILRWHESGDFYSQAYVDKVTQVVANLPDRVFYAYTKRLKDWDFTCLKARPNMILINSAQFGPVNYGDAVQVEAWRAAGALVCPAGGGAGQVISCNNGCNLCCSLKMKPIVEARGVVFHKH